MKKRTASSQPFIFMYSGVKYRDTLIKVQRIKFSRVSMLV